MMKRLLFITLSLIFFFTTALSASHALYVKDSEGIHKYSFGVAGDLKFSEDGKVLYITGYESGIILEQVEYITFDMPTDGQMSSTEQKDKLLAIGEELNSKINANNAADIIGFVKEFSNLSYCNQDNIFSQFEENHPDLFYNSPAYQKSLSEIIKAMGNLAKGDFSAVRKISTVYTELFTRGDLTGVFTVDTEKGEWVKTADADYFELIFTGPAMGKNYSFRIDTSTEYTEWQEEIVIKNTDSSTTVYDVTGRVPKTITGVVKMQNTIIFNGEVDVVLNQDNKTIDITTTVDCAKINVEDIIAISNTSANDTMTVTINNEQVLTSSVELSGSQLLNIPEWVDDMQGIEDYDGYEYYYEIDGKSVLRKFGKVTSNTDILGKLQLQGHIANYDKSYDEMETYINENDDIYYIEVDHDKRTISEYYGSEYWMGKIASIINNYTDVSFYYDNNSQLQGFISWDVDIYDDDDYYYTSEYWDEEKGEWVELPEEYKYIWVEFGLTPRLTFADGSSFNFNSTYFTGSNFQKLVNNAEDIVDTINNILSDYTIYYSNN